MRKEYVIYEDDLPVRISLVNIWNYPLSWQDSIRIFFVLEGSMVINLGNECFTLREKEIEIVNEGEIYAIKSEEDNLILIVDIDPNFFPRYNDQVENIYYYTNTMDNKDQSDRKYQKLREYLAMLFYELLTRKKDYEERIEKILLLTMYHLLNNFHHLFYEEESIREEESLREDDVQFKRFSRIITYLRENYSERISLKEIAEREHLTSQYLSYKIKDTFGQSYNDFLNIIRIEESRKLLLDTDWSISKIARESGFSHSRYYNKHFKKQFNCSPAEYRDKYRKTGEEIETSKNLVYQPLKKGMDYLETYIQDYDSYTRVGEIVRRHIDLDGRRYETYRDLEVINLGDPSRLLEEEYKEMLREVQEEIGFKYALVEGLFSERMNIYRGDDLVTNWKRVRNLLDFLSELGLRPVVDLERVDQGIIADFMENFSQLDQDVLVEDYRRFFSVGDHVSLERIEGKKDQLGMNSLIFNQHFFGQTRVVPKLYDEIYRGDLQDNDTFFGGSGLFTSNGLRKPIYYGYLFISHLSGELVHSEPGLLVTRSGKDFQILVYDPGPGHKISCKRKISINLTGVRSNYRLTRLELDRWNGSVYDAWLDLGSPVKISRDHLEELDKYVRPRLTYRVVKGRNVFNLLEGLESFAAKLYTFKEIE